MKKIIKILSGLLIVIAVLSVIVWQSSRNQELKVYFFDVGQGDAILIRTPSRQNIVIDGGPDNSFITKLGETLPFYDKTIDLMVLTHPHDDHLFGLIEVLKRYQVKQVLSTGVIHTTDAYLDWLKIIRDKKIPLKVAQAGQKYIFGQIELKVLYPFQDFTNQQVENLHEAMVVVQLVYGEVKIMFTGDLEEAGETEILKQYQPELHSQLIKIAHHGSTTSSNNDFLKAIAPQFAVISVGADNKFGHPSLRIIRRLEKLGIKIYRTDQAGDITAVTDNQKITIISQNSH